MEKWGFFLVFSLFLLFQVSAYEIVCTDGFRGVKVWNYNQTFNESEWNLQDLENDAGMNCTFVEKTINLTECKHYEPIIDQLNANIWSKDKIIQKQEGTIKRQRFYKYFTIIFIIMTVVLAIMLKINFKEQKNEQTRKKSNTA